MPELETHELPDRPHGIMERSLAVSSLWQVGRQRRSASLQREGLFGSVSKVERAALGEVEQSVLSWVCAHWWEQGSPSTGIVRFTWYQLARALWSEYAPGGREHEALRQAVDNLMAAVVTLGGFSIHSGRWEPELVSKVHILRSTEYGRRSAQGPTVDGGSREDTVEVRLEEWIMAQLLGYEAFWADWEVERALSSTSRRLWYYLGGRGDAFTAGAWPGEENAAIVLDEALWSALDISHSRPAARRATLKRAAARIATVDRRYKNLVVERDPERRGGWRLRAVREHLSDRRAPLASGDETTGRGRAPGQMELESAV